MDVKALTNYITEALPGKELGSLSTKGLQAFGAAVAVVALYELTGYVLRELILVPRLTILRDLDDLGKPRKGGKIPGRAIVCGGSVSGLLAAAVCANHFESVLVIEPETGSGYQTELPDKRDYRTGSQGEQTIVQTRMRVMQYHLGHFFQPPVHMTLSRLFPNLSDHLDYLGLTSCLDVTKMKVYFGGVQGEDPYTDAAQKGAPLSLSITREALETLIRRAVKYDHPSVTIKTGTVTKFTPDGHGRLAGVKIRTEREEIEEKADFVIDATGPNQLAFTRGLKAAGFSVSPDLKLEYDPAMKYGTSTWVIPEHVRAKWPVPGGFRPGTVMAMAADAKIGETKVMFIMVAENNQLRILTGGWDTLATPLSMTETRSYAESLLGSEKFPSWLWDLFSLLEKNAIECNGYFTTAKVGLLSWIQWHKAAKELPPNFVAVGDAIMKVNPVYGQGVSKACIDITTLDATLRRVPSALPLTDIGKNFFAREMSRVEGLWEGTKANDYGWPTTIPIEGENLSDGAFIRTWARDCLMVGQTDPVVYSTWWHVTQILAPGSDLLAPSIVFKVMRRKLLGW